MHAIRASLAQARQSSSSTTPAAHIELEYQYKPQQSLGSQERNPLVVAWTTLPQEKEHAPAFHRHLLPTEESAAVRVSFPYDASQSWHQDACVRFLLMTQIRSSEGQWTYAKTASTEVFLADLMRKDNNKYHVLPMRVQSYYMPPPEKSADSLVEAERHKGDLHVRMLRAPTHVVSWNASSHLDVTPSNAAALQAAMMLPVTRGMSPFDSNVSKVVLKPTLPEIENVHAPFYVQETPVPLDGATFWSRVPDVAKQHVAHHGGHEEANQYLHVLLTQSLARHNMTKQRFLQTAKAFEGQRSSSSSSDAGKLTAVAVMATACTMRVNMMRYVADKAVLAKSKSAVVVESFDQVDLRTAYMEDTGGVVSQDVGTATTTVHKISSRPVMADAANAAVGGAMDCEDGARDAAVHFSLLSDPGSGLPDAAITSSVVRAARTIGQHYRAVGFLTSVLSRNLSDATAGPGDNGNDGTAVPPIGSFRDQQVQVGAHMFTLLIPKRVLVNSIYRAMDSKGVSRRRFDMGEPSQAPIASPMSRGKELPVALCEGTGLLHPLMLPKEAYATDVHVKTAKGVAAVLEQEAQLRLRTGKTSDELVQAQMVAAQGARQQQQQQQYYSGDDATASPLVLELPAALDAFGPMHQQERVLDDPNQRIVPSFYRTAAEGYLVPTSHQLQERRRPGRQSSPNRLVGDRLIPMQMGTPPDRPVLRQSRDSLRFRKAQASAAKRGRRVTQDVTWGLAVSDILRQRSFVGFLPTPEPLPTETQIVDRVHSHVAPAVSLHLDKDLGSDRYVKAAQGWIHQLRQTQTPRLPSVSQALKRLDRKYSKGQIQRRYVLTHGYAHPRDLKGQSVDTMVQWIRSRNPHVVGLSMALEQSTYRLAMLRLDALVDCGEVADQAEPRLAQQMRARAIQDKKRYRLASIACRPERAEDRYLQQIGRHADRPTSFKAIMLRHIELTVIYVVASWHNRHTRTDLPLDHPAVQALIQQFEDWRQAINDRVSPEALRQYSRIWHSLTDRRYFRMPSPGELWVTQLIHNHTVFAKHIADAAWYPNDPQQQRKKAKALADVTGLNNRRIAAFWASLVPPGGPGRALDKWWDKHLKCTAKYIDTLARTGDPSHDSEFDRDVMACLSKGSVFGRILDRNL